MLSFKRRFLALSVLLAACLASSASLLAGSASAAATAPFHILVMGDSYSAGNGAGSYYGPTGCYRSHHDYAEDLAQTIRSAPYNLATTVDNVACSGAVTADFRTGKSGRPPELNGITKSDNLILVTAGGNDAYFADIVQYCLIAKTRDGANCNQDLIRAESLLSSGTLQSRVTQVLKDVKARANSSAEIVLLGYPFLEGDTSYTLRSGHGNNAPIIKVGARLRALQVADDKLDSAAVQTANGTGKQLRFVSVQSLFNGPPFHGLYAQKNNPNRWMVQPFVDASIVTRNTWYHPNPTGWSKEAALLLSDGVVPGIGTPLSYSGGTWTINGTVGQTLTATHSVSGGELPLTITPSLGGSEPAWLSLSGSGHQIALSGTPTTSGTSVFSLQVQDAWGQTVAVPVSVQIQPDSQGTYSLQKTINLPNNGMIDYGASDMTGSLLSFDPEAPRVPFLFDTATGSQMPSCTDYTGAAIDCWPTFLSADGSVLTFNASGDVVSPSEDPTDSEHVYQRNVGTGLTTRLTFHTDGDNSPFGEGLVSTTPDGRFVLFQTDAPVVGPDGQPSDEDRLYRLDTQTNDLQQIEPDAGALMDGLSAQISSNGEYVVFRDEYYSPTSVNFGPAVVDLSTGMRKVPTGIDASRLAPRGVSNSGDVIYSGQYTSDIYHFGTGTTETIAPPQASDVGVSLGSLSPDGTLVLESGTNGGSCYGALDGLYVRSLQTGALTAVGPESSCAVDDDVPLTIGNDGTVVVWGNGALSGFAQTVKIFGRS